MFCASCTGTPQRSSASTSCSSEAIQALEKVRLMKPVPLTSTESQTPSRSRASTIFAATSRGGAPTFLARASAALTCTSANCDGRSTGSTSRKSSPSAVAIADWTFGVSATSGETMRASLGAHARCPRRGFPAGRTPGGRTTTGPDAVWRPGPVAGRRRWCGSVAAPGEAGASRRVLVVEPDVGLDVVVAVLAGRDEAVAVTDALDGVTERLRAVGDRRRRAHAVAAVDDLVVLGHATAGRGGRRVGAAGRVPGVVGSVLRVDVTGLAGLVGRRGSGVGRALLALRRLGGIVTLTERRVAGVRGGRLLRLRRTLTARR